MKLSYDSYRSFNPTKDLFLLLSSRITLFSSLCYLSLFYYLFCRSRPSMVSEFNRNHAPVQDYGILVYSDVSVSTSE